MRDESLVERIVRATNHAKAALTAGYTSYLPTATSAPKTCAMPTSISETLSTAASYDPGPRIRLDADADVFKLYADYPPKATTAVSGPGLARVAKEITYVSAGE
ncbi:hypothetical protein F4779DRAFT_623228 [Xylariaceae sp. FL0662B]|nr:hypothetical protein F4779DRAFT_623228 [Xylariaceae sp. FL0662B]